MKRLTIVLLAVSVTFGSFWVYSAETGANETTVAAAGDQTVESLLAMAPDARRAYLKTLAPAERWTLWNELKRAKNANHAAKAETKYRDMTPTAVNATKPESWATKAVGTIAYDSGFPTIGFGGGAFVGNKFDTHTQIPVLASGTVSTVQALVVPGPVATTSSAVAAVYGPQTANGGAAALWVGSTSPTGVIDSITFAGLGINYTGSTFLVLLADFANAYIPVFGTGSTLAQGHHGIVGYLSSGGGPTIDSTFDFGGALNSFVRATGNIVPVELLSFDAE